MANNYHVNNEHGTKGNEGYQNKPVKATDIQTRAIKTSLSKPTDSQ